MDDERLIEGMALALYKREVEFLKNISVPSWLELGGEYPEQHQRHLAEARAALNAYRTMTQDDGK